MKAVALVLALFAAVDAYRAPPSMLLDKLKAAIPEKGTSPAPAPKKAPIQRAKKESTSTKGPMLAGAGSTNLIGKEQTYFGGPEVQSVALPYTTTTLDGTLPGDVGFDPFGLAATAPGCWFLGEKYKTIGLGTLTWYREAELMHGRIAQLAALGWIFPEIAHFPGKESLGIDFSEVNPLEAIGSVPAQANWQIFAFATLLEGGRIRKIIAEGDAYQAGDLGLGQGSSNISPFGEGRFNPFGFDYTPEEFAEKQLQEIKHCRLAMLAVFFQYTKSADLGPGEGVLSDFLSAFSSPAYVENAGYFFPEGV